MTTIPTKTKQREPWMDIAKGICMLSIIYGHTSTSGLDPFQNIFRLPVFFLLCGYTLKRDFSGAFFHRKFRGIMVPYFVTVFALICMDTFNSIVVQNSVDLNAVSGIISTHLLHGFAGSGSITMLGSYDLGGNISAIWFLPALFFSILFVEIILHKIENKPGRYAAALILAAVAQFSSGSWLPFSIQSGALACPLVLAGYDIRQYGLLEKIRLKHFAVSLAVALLAILIDKSMASFVTAFCSDLLLTPIAELAASICIFYISRHISWCKPLAFVGRYSGYYLCIHNIELRCFDWIYHALCSTLQLSWNVGVVYLMKVIVITILTAMLLCFKKLLARRPRPAELQDADKGTIALQMTNAFLLVFIVLSQWSIDETLCRILCSFHLFACVFYAGYQFRDDSLTSLRGTILRLCRRILLPYGVFALLYVLTHSSLSLGELADVLLCMGSARDWLTPGHFVGPIYLLPVLFLALLLYLLVLRFSPNELWEHGIVLVLSLLGTLLGYWGCRLPLSFDCVLYGLVILHLGRCFKKYHILQYLTEHSYSYFLLSFIWACTIYIGISSFAGRTGSNYSFSLFGAVSGTVLLYMMCCYLAQALPRCFQWVLRSIGKSFVYTLLVYTLFSAPISAFVGTFLTQSYIWHFFVYLALLLACGMAIWGILNVLKRLCAITIHGASA